MPSPVPGCRSSSGHSRDQQEQLRIRTGDSDQNTCFAPGTREGGRPILQTCPPWSCKLGHGAWLQKCCWDTSSHQGAPFLLLRCFHQEPLKLRFYRSFHCRDYKLKCLLGPAIFIHLAQILYIKHIQALSPSIKNMLSTICFSWKTAPSSSIFGFEHFTETQTQEWYRFPLHSLRKI